MATHTGVGLLIQDGVLDVDVIQDIVLKMKWM